MHDFYKERGLEVPKPGKFGCILSCIYTLKNTLMIAGYFMIKERYILKVMIWYNPI